MFSYECNKCFLIRLAQNKVRMIYLCFHDNLINMHKAQLPYMEMLRHRFSMSVWVH